MSGPVERIAPAQIHVGDTIGSTDASEWMTVARIRSDVVVREDGSARDALRIFTFEDGEEGEQVWTFLEKAAWAACL
jgi:hypothetical protein